MKIKIILFASCILFSNFLFSQNYAFKVQPYLSYQDFKNYGEITSSKKLNDGFSLKGNESSFGLNFLLNNTGIKFEMSRLMFKGNGNPNRTNLFEEKYDEVLGLSYTSSVYGNAGFLFDDLSLGIVQQFKIKKMSFGWSLSGGLLTPRNTPSYKSRIYEISSDRAIFSWSESQELSIAETASYDKGTYLSATADLGYYLYKDLYLFAALNYKVGKFDYIIEHRELSGQEVLIDETINTDMRFATLGLQLGLNYTFGFY